MFNVVLYQPEIPPNTGNIVRLCANTGASLHLIEPLGFSLDQKQLRRAAMDYRELACVTRYPSWRAFGDRHPEMRLTAFSTRGARPYSNCNFHDNDGLVFGPETRGLPQTLLEEITGRRVFNIPMVSGSRSLNLSNAVAVVLYEALRQTGFENML